MANTADASRTEWGTVHVVDDDAAAAVAIKRLLAAAGFEARSYLTAREFLGSFDPARPGCIILDLQLPDLNGLDLQEAITAREETLPIVFLTGNAEVPDTVRAIRHGAIDFLIKPVDGPVLLAAVSRALAQNAIERREREHRRRLQALYERLTAREREVLAHLVTGQRNKEVAADLHVSERTIKLHRASIYQKLEIDSIANLTRFAVDLEIAGGRPS